VKRAWRGRRVAIALKHAQIASAKEHRLRQLVTQNEERNAPVLRLNDRLGYRPESVRLFVRGPLSDGA
jgi:mycothiol synthase